MCLTLGLSVYGLRRSHYDLFLALHIVFAIVFLVCVYRHVTIWSGAFNGFIWPCVANWSFDRLIRLCRVVYISLIPYFLKGTRAVASYSEEAHVIRLDITDFLRTTEIRPGLFYYLYLPGSMPGWESHPFSFCSWRVGELPAAVMSLPPSVTGDMKTGYTAKTSATDPETQSCVRHTFLIRQYSGMTGRMKRQIASSAGARGSATNLTVLLEGPYGIKLDLSQYSDVLILAGGSGVTAAVTHSSLLLDRGNARIRIVWAVAQKQLVDDLCAHELSAIVDSDKVHIDVHLTEDVVLQVGEAGGKYAVHLGRPDLCKVMEAARESCKTDLAIVSCGTSGMADACRKAVVTLLEKPGPHFGYYNETLTW